jgi:hypothetical protein
VAELAVQLAEFSASAAGKLGMPSPSAAPSLQSDFGKASRLLVLRSIGFVPGNGTQAAYC